MLGKLKRLYRRRKAVSPVIAAMLLIAVTVAAIFLVYFIVVPFFSKTELIASVYSCRDTNKDSRYDQITIQIANTGTANLNITEIIVWTCPSDSLENKASWEAHIGWTFLSPSDSLVPPSAIKKVRINGADQIVLTIVIETYYRLEIHYTGEKIPYFSEWKLLNDRVDFADLIDDFELFDLQAWGFEGTIDAPGRPTNNYNSTGGPDYGPLIKGQFNYFPVLDELELIPFYITGKIVVFHSNEAGGNLSSQPKIQTLNRTDDPLRARKLFVLGLAGSWGDDFSAGDWALRVQVTYTDDSTSTWDLGHEYIDDWWYRSNNYPPPDGPQYIGCISDDYYSGFITEIDLGTQVDTPNQPVHTHTTRFYLDIYKYIKTIAFIDPGDDNSAPHLLSLTLG